MLIHYTLFSVIATFDIYELYLIRKINKQLFKNFKKITKGYIKG